MTHNVKAEMNFRATCPVTIILALGPGLYLNSTILFWPFLALIPKQCTLQLLVLASQSPLKNQDKEAHAFTPSMNRFGVDDCRWHTCSGVSRPLKLEPSHKPNSKYTHKVMTEVPLKKMDD